MASCQDFAQFISRSAAHGHDDSSNPAAAFIDRTAPYGERLRRPLERTFAGRRSHIAVEALYRRETLGWRNDRVTRVRTNDPTFDEKSSEHDSPTPMLDPQRIALR